MKTALTAIAALVISLTVSAGAAVASVPDDVAGATVVAPAAPGAVPSGPRPLPRATEESVSPSAEPSASPSPAGRRPVDEEGERWVNLATIAGIGLLGTVVAFMIAGGVMRHRSRRRDG